MSTSLLSAPGPIRPGKLGSDSAAYVDADTLRTTVALAMSAMYKAEVPLYGDLVHIVQKVNQDVYSRRLLRLEDSATTMDASIERLTLERHGAIRLGTPKELHTVRRVFALLGMSAVGYYDLSVAGLPMHATCFRPVSSKSLDQNPFRVFTTLLRPQLLRSGAARAVAMDLLDRRSIFSDALLDLLDIAETTQQGRLTLEQGNDFVTEVLRTFSWQPLAIATHDEYSLLCDEHPILADITCFRSSHINHLTPRALDITAAQEAMLAAGMAVKSRIEGPPPRECPVLLRQTSFLAIREGIRFPVSEGGDFVDSFHKARFGEIEERGAAITPLGRKLYDDLLNEAMDRAKMEGRTADPTAVDAILQKTFEKYPDDWDELRRRRLVYFKYRCAQDARKILSSLGGLGAMVHSAMLDRLVSEGVLEALPITYEDFLPFSAAGIFQSNLHQRNRSGESAMDEGEKGKPDLEGFETALQCRVYDANELYARAQRRSLENCAGELGLSFDDISRLF
ncbi:duf1338 domain protein [Colletotrichum plurivorum]|uniref:2-oxoadipate dioxygenase/decarboxylase n=1 Tax=Colletotrichum plurivorum TaxID=2175906 RepID=A0A8H6J8W3_9PEZI|nr:duf1338 domain protein [Colletotrichum plurivorum]